MSSSRKTPPADGAATTEAWPATPFFSLMSPAVSPWSMSALAPFTAQTARTALIGVDAVENAVTAWRRLFDVSRMALRAQQDIAFAMLRSQLPDAAGPAPDDAVRSRAESVLAPMIAAAKAYGEVGEAMLGAQRDALEALAQRPH